MPASASDQRGLPRPFDVASIANSTTTLADASDIGAVELQASDFVKASPPPPVAKKSCKKKKKKVKRGASAARKCKKKRKGK